MVFYCISRAACPTIDEMVMRVNGNIGGTAKVLLLKMSVGLIVLEGLIEQILVVAGE